MVSVHTNFSSIFATLLPFDSFSASLTSLPVALVSDRYMRFLELFVDRMFLDGIAALSTADQDVLEEFMTRTNSREAVEEHILKLLTEKGFDVAGHARTVLDEYLSLVRGAEKTLTPSPTKP